MSKADRRSWSAPETSLELGELVALWLEGEIDSQPGYAPGWGPDEETALLMPSLAAANRAGFVTTNSQAGEQWWWAWVHGFVDDFMRHDLELAAHRHGLLFWALKPEARRDYYETFDGTRVRGTSVRALIRELRGEREDLEQIGTCLSRRTIRDGYGICSTEVQDELCRAWQVTLVDPEPGRNRAMTSVLADVAR